LQRSPRALAGFPVKEKNGEGKEKEREGKGLMRLVGRLLPVTEGMDTPAMRL